MKFEKARRSDREVVEEWRKYLKCNAVKTWRGGYTGINYVLVCDRENHDDKQHHWVHA